MIVIKLREAMQGYKHRTGERMTYKKLSALTGISEGTLESIGGRLGYTPTFANVEKLCRTLDVPFHDMVEMVDDPPKSKSKAKRKAKKK